LNLFGRQFLRGLVHAQLMENMAADPVFIIPDEANRSSPIMGEEKSVLAIGQDRIRPAAAVNVLVIEAIRNLVAGVLGISSSRSAKPHPAL
jgi:hypothetical protein